MASSSPTSSPFVGTRIQHDFTFKSVEEYVQKTGGTKVIDTVLIANNGIAAVKAIRSIRQWAYTTFGNERAIQFVVMATPEDLAVNAEYIRMADQIEEVPGGSNVNNYANVDLIVDIAERRGVHAVWAGWGHASENPKLPDALSKTKVAFMGPPAKAMRDLGDKIASTLVAQSANVNCVPWSGSHIKINYAEQGIPDNIYSEACVHTLEEAQAALKKIGLPIMVKASEGGGGKGIRKVVKDEDLPSAFRQVQGEVPGSPIFMMKMLNKCRHLEVQVIGDQYGQAISLYGRDCSVQRRHQKIIEEGPAIAAPPAIWERMEQAAVRMAMAVGYSGAGTIEYLFSDEESNYYFLELNPRLQVEHPVTEQITGVNLPATQLNIAMGIPLHRIPDIRRLYGADPYSDSHIDLSTASRLPPKAHVIAARITGENPDEGFKPTSGGIRELTFRSTPNVWGYFSVGANGGLHEYADSQFGHIFSRGATREEARRELVIGLKELSIRGDISTPVAYVTYLLETDTFRNNQVTTSWLDRLIAEDVHEEKPNVWLVVICGALYKAHRLSAERHSKYMSLLERGQIPEKELLDIVDNLELIYLNVKYCFKTKRSGTNSFILSLVGKEDTIEGEVRPLGDGGLLILLDGRSHVCYGTTSPAGLKLILNGRTCVFTQEYDPSQLRSSTSGKLVRYLVDNGSHIKGGTPYAEMEVMKMYLPLISTEPGRITFVQQEGNILEVGSLIATIELDDPSKVQKASPFIGQLPEMKPPTSRGDKPHQILRESVISAKKILTGYYNPNIKKMAQQLFAFLRNALVPLLEIQETFSKLQARIPKALSENLVKEIAACKLAIESNKDSQFFAAKVKADILKFYNDIPSTQVQQQKDFMNLIQPILELANKFEFGMPKHAEALYTSLLKEYIAVESCYQIPRENLIANLRQVYKNELKKIWDIEISHHSLIEKNKLVLQLLEEVERIGLSPYGSILHELSDLQGLGHREVAFKARRMLVMYRLPSFAERMASLEKELSSPEKISQLISQPSSIFDVVVACLFHTTGQVRSSAMEVYLGRTYQAYLVKDLEINGPRAEWYYAAPKKQSDKLAIKRVNTDDNLLKTETEQKAEFNEGYMVLAEEESVRNIIEQEVKHLQPTDLMNRVLKLVINQKQESPLDEDQSAALWLSELLKNYTKQLRTVGIKRVTAVVCKYGHFPRYFTFRERLNYQEDQIYRNIEPPLAHHLELTRLSSYDYQLVPTENKQIHLYYAEEKGKKPNEVLPQCPRLFARILIRGGLLTIDALFDYLVSEAENVLSEACNALELALHDPRYKNAVNNHIFLNFLPEVIIAPERVRTIISELAAKYNKRLGKARVGEVELVGKVTLLSKSTPTTIRFVATNPTTYKFNIDAYVETKDSRTKKTVLNSLFGEPGPYDGKETESYPVPSTIERKRILAHQNNTTYVYDFIELFTEALRMLWKKYATERKDTCPVVIPKTLLHAAELVLTKSGGTSLRYRVTNAPGLEEITRPYGQNEIGMVAWKLKLFTPEYPQGRSIIVIANDITFQIGSFGPQEDLLFKKVSELARSQGIPRIYMACNSGARIGLAEELKSKFTVAWNDELDPTKGFKFLYVNDEEYAHLSRLGSINGKKVAENCWMITDIIGVADGLGVENLRGSGMIAGETSRAYEEIFTLTLVTGRTVGIGAYLVRLGQRTIQNKGPVILTGASALNKVLGRNVYSSNVQLGGTQIMFANGVSHIIVNDEIEGVLSILNWLSYVPLKKGDPVPSIDSVDPVDRVIDFVPTKSPYDPRHMIGGYFDTANDRWINGFFDKDSFTETLAGWGKTVVVGRARLGGIPMGIIAVETRTVERVNPADPALLDSHESVLQQAGQVWFPDSAYKTAQAIKDFNRGEELPLIIFANWRGFSGGLRDLYEEILKFGSYIVDNLRDYQHPVFIYIPPCGELRGGAWVVLDPTINPDKMEMYCDENGRGGVLEPNGTVEIKYKQKDILKTMHRIDSKLQELVTKQKGAQSKEEADQAKKQIEIRERELTSVYEQVAITFADLHDTPGRMKAKGCIREVLAWKVSRQYFFYRVKRRLSEEYLKKSITTANPTLLEGQATELMQGWMKSIGGDDRAAVAWFESESAFIQQQLKSLREEYPTYL